MLELVEELIDLLEPSAIVASIDRAIPRIFGESARLRLDLDAAPSGPHLALTSPSGVTMGYLTDAPSPASDQVRRVFSKLAGWALSRALPTHGPVWSDWLRMARLVVEEGLPQSDIRLGQWQISGALRPAFHVGGDCFSYLVNDEVLCFLLLDAVGHGVGSALLAASCRSLWRGVVYEKDLSVAIARLNERLFLDTGSDRFVAATMGYCLPDGSVDYVCAGQSPIFFMDGARVETLSECDPPLGLFGDWSFQVQRIKVPIGSGLLAVTDGVLEWRTPARGMFGEQGVLQALRQPLLAAEDAIQAVLESLEEFAGGTPPPDDVCILCIWRDPVAEES